ncbi:hypothetical protein AC233_33195 [Burkholderia sp. HB1]|nr:hypothetical protein AC233_33195 [Burkholderia sp. HB1]
MNGAGLPATVATLWISPSHPISAVLLYTVDRRVIGSDVDRTPAQSVAHKKNGIVPHETMPLKKHHTLAGATTRVLKK